MDVVLTGSSPGATTAGILLMSRARQLGLPLRVSLLGDPDDITPVPGPALVYAPVLASCGVGRKLGTGGTVIVSGNPGKPLQMSLDEHGLHGWFVVDRFGAGTHPATQAYTRLSNDARVPARHLAKDLRRAMDALGCAAEPAILDILFGAPAPALTRLAVALRAGRAMHGGRGMPVTQFLSPGLHDGIDPLPAGLDSAHLAEWQQAQLSPVLDGLSPVVRDRVEDWLDIANRLAAEDGQRDEALIYGLLEVLSNYVLLPAQSILPPLDHAADAVATSVSKALTSNGDGDASFQLSQMFRFMGGKYVDEAQHAVTVDSVPPPADPEQKWAWFCGRALEGRERAEQIWSEIWERPT